MTKSLKDTMDEAKIAGKEQVSEIFDRIKKADKLLGAEPVKTKKEKFARTLKVSYSIPEFDLKLFKTILTRALPYQLIPNNSEIVRAGLIALLNATDKEFAKAISSVKKIKKGIPPRD